MGSITVYVDTDVEVDVQDIIDSMSPRDLEKLSKEMDLKRMDEEIHADLTPRQVLLKLRGYKIDLVGLRDAILEVLPLTEASQKCKKCNLRIPPPGESGIGRPMCICSEVAAHIS